jgi:ribonuclease HI
MYIATHEHVIGAALTQSDEGKEFVVAYLSWRVVDVETRYTPIEKRCLSLYYACTKLRYYLLTSSCMIICQYNIIKYMLQRPIFSGRLGKWVYSLVEYDLEYEALKAMKGQILADFIVEHHIMEYKDICMAEEGAWEFFFDGCVCSQGRGIGCFIKSPKGAEYEVSTRLEFGCTNNQSEYEALLTGLEVLVEVGAERVEAYGDSELVVQQMKGESQCLSGELNEYRDKCLDLLRNFKEFSIGHVAREGNTRANALAQQASGYIIRRGRFGFIQRPATDAVLVIQGENGEVVDGGCADN